jgi:hypothetical protein
MKYDNFYKQKSAQRDLDVAVGTYPARFFELPWNKASVAQKRLIDFYRWELDYRNLVFPHLVPPQKATNQ